MLTLEQFVLTRKLLYLLPQFVFFRLQEPGIGNFKRFKSNTPCRKHRPGIVREDCRSCAAMGDLECQCFLNVAIIYN